MSQLGSDPDNLESFLRTSLDDFAPEAPDRLWSGIEARLPERRKRLVVWWWIFGIVVTGAGLAALRVGIQNTLNALPAASQSIAQDQSGKSQYTQLQPVDHASANHKIQPAATRHNFVKPGYPQPVGLLAAVGSMPALSGTAQPIRGVVQAQSSNDKIDAPPFLPGLTLQLLPASKPAEPVACIIKPARPASGFFAGWTAAPVWIWPTNTTNTTSTQHTGHVPAFTEQSGSVATGWQTGFTAGYTIAPGWAVETGLLRRTVRQTLFHSATLKLMDGICLNPASTGIKRYEFTYALQSRAGDTEVKVNIAQADSTSHMAADEPFTLNMKTIRQNTDWIVPVALRRSFGHGRLQGFARAGVSLEIPGKTTILVEHYSEACVDLCFASGQIPSMTATRAPTVVLQYQIGGGIAYYFNARLSLSVEPALFGRKGQTGFSSSTNLLYRF